MDSAWKSYFFCRNNFDFVVSKIVAIFRWKCHQWGFIAIMILFSTQWCLWVMSAKGDVKLNMHVQSSTAVFNSVHTLMNVYCMHTIFIPDIDLDTFSILFFSLSFFLFVPSSWEPAHYQCYFLSTSLFHYQFQTHREEKAHLNELEPLKLVYAWILGFSINTPNELRKFYLK